MAQQVETLVQVAPRHNADHAALALQWRALNRIATLVAVLASPALYLVLRREADLTYLQAILLTVLGVAAFRGLIDVAARRMIPWPNLFGAEQRHLAEDVVSRRRAWYWQKRYRLLFLFIVSQIIILTILL